LHMATQGVANDLRFVMLMRNQNRLKFDFNQNHKSHVFKSGFVNRLI